MFPGIDTIDKEQAILLSELKQSDFILLTNTNLTDTPPEPIISAKMLGEQKRDCFCRDIVAWLQTSDVMAFMQCKKGTLFRIAHGDYLIFVSEAL